MSSKRNLSPKKMLESPDSKMRYVHLWRLSTLETVENVDTEETEETADNRLKIWKSITQLLCDNL